jgi:hypothetical protein
MSRMSLLLVALMTLGPASALAHGSHESTDLTLHVDPTVKDCSVRLAPELTQEAFQRFVREFGSVSAFKLMTPPTTLGTKGVSIGLEQINFTVDENADAWNDTFTHPNDHHPLGDDKSIPMARLSVGVARKVDIGAYYTRNPNANYGWLGVDAKYGMLQQSRSMPVSVALRGAYTRTLYVEDMDMNTFTFDIAVGRTFWNAFTPYLGAGSDMVLARETTDAVSLSNESQGVGHVLGGFEVRFWHLAVGAVAYRGALDSYQVGIATVF